MVVQPSTAESWLAGETENEEPTPFKLHRGLHGSGHFATSLTGFSRISLIEPTGQGRSRPAFHTRRWKSWTGAYRSSGDG